MSKRARSPRAKAARRARLLEAALDTFFEQGFAAARMEDIARRAGVSKGTVYLYFASKEEMFHAIVDTVAQPRIETIERALDTAPGLLDTLPRLMHLAAEFAQDSPMPKIAKILIGEGNQFTALLQEYRSRIIDRLLAALTRLIERAGEQGEIVVKDPGLTARLIVAPIVFSALWQVSFGRDARARLDIPALLELHGRMIKQALTCKDPPQ